MCCKPICLIFLYTVKSAAIFSWILRSILLIRKRYYLISQDFSSMWNILTSILILVLDCLMHASVFTHNRSRTLHRVLLILFIIGIGPVLLIMSLLGSVNDSIDYSDLFCEGGCVSII